MAVQHKVALGIAALSCALVASGCSGDSSSEEGGVTLTMNTMVTETHPMGQSVKAWMEQVTERTDGAVQFEEHFNGALCAGTETTDCIESGTVDIGGTPVGYSPDMGLSQVGNVLFTSTSMQASIDAFNKLYTESEEFQQEYAGRNQRMLFSVSNSFPVLLTSKPLESLDDLAGQDIRAYDAMGRAVQDLGANAVALDAQEIYESIQRGVILGSTFPLEGATDFGLTEIAKGIYDLGAYTGNYALNTFAINADAWDRLSDEQQQTINEVSSEVSGEFVEKYMVPALLESCEIAEKDGLTVEKLGPEATGEAWAEEGQVAQRQEFIENAAGATDNPEGFFEQYQAYLDEFGGEDFQATSEICA